jgi:hypothetical protein
MAFRKIGKERNGVVLAILIPRIRRPFPTVLEFSC